MTTTPSVTLTRGDTTTLADVEQFLAAKKKPCPQTKEMYTGAEAGADVAAGQLRAFVERIERLEEEKKVIGEDIKDIYSEAKGNGYDVKILRMVIGLRKKDPHQLEEEQAVLDLYMHALGMAGPSD